MPVAAAGGAGQEFHGRTATFPLLLTAAQVRFTLGVMRHVQGAFAAQLAINVVFINQAEHQGRRSAEHTVELAAHGVAKSGFDVIGAIHIPAFTSPTFRPEPP